VTPGGVQGFEGDVPDLFAMPVPWDDVSNPMTIVGPDYIEEP
jgi:hypothetical protein